MGFQSVLLSFHSNVLGKKLSLSPKLSLLDFVESLESVRGVFVGRIADKLAELTVGPWLK